MFKFNLQFNYENMIHQAHVNDRDLLEGTLEWIHAYPSLANHFFEALKNDSKFAKTYYAYYEPARALFYRRTNKEPVEAPICEESARTNQLMALEWSARYSIWLREELEWVEGFLPGFENEVARGRLVDRSASHRELILRGYLDSDPHLIGPPQKRPLMPEDWEAKKRSRSRSRSRSKSRSNKRKREDAEGEEVPRLPRRGRPKMERSKVHMSHTVSSYVEKSPLPSFDYHPANAVGRGSHSKSKTKSPSPAPSSQSSSSGSLSGSSTESSSGSD